MDYLGLVLRWLHVLPAVILAGGAIYMRWPLAAACADLQEQPRAELLGNLRRRWSGVVMVTSALLLVTGLINAVRIIVGYGGEQPTGDYHALVAIKLLLALALMMISSLLAGRTSLAKKMQQKGNFWLNVNLVLAVVLVLLGGLMKFMPRVPVESEDAPAVALLDSKEFAPWTAKTRSV